MAIIVANAASAARVSVTNLTYFWFFDHQAEAEYFETSLHKLGSRAKEALREFWPKDGAGRTKKTTNGRGNSSMG